MMKIIFRIDWLLRMALVGQQAGWNRAMRRTRSFILRPHLHNDYVDCVCLGWLAEELVDVMGKVAFCAEGRGIHFVSRPPDPLSSCAYAFLVFT